MAGTAPIGPARCLWLLSWLPEGSAFVASLRGGPEHRPWTLSATLAAGVLHALNQGNWQRGGGSGAPPQALPIPQVKGATGSRKNGRPSAEARAARRAELRAAHARGSNENHD